MTPVTTGETRYFWALWLQITWYTLTTLCMPAPFNCRQAASPARSKSIVCLFLVMQYHKHCARLLCIISTDVARTREEMIALRLADDDAAAISVFGVFCGRARCHVPCTWPVKHQLYVFISCHGDKTKTTSNNSFIALNQTLCVSTCKRLQFLAVVLKMESRLIYAWFNYAKASHTFTTKLYNLNKYLSFSLVNK